jgi:hypothetical protein
MIHPLGGKSLGLSAALGLTTPMPQGVFGVFSYCQLVMLFSNPIKGRGRGGIVSFYGKWVTLMCHGEMK